MSLELVNAGDTVLTHAQMAALDQFDETLNFCIQSFQRGNDSVVLPHNIFELFGDLVLQYFKRSMADEVGVPVTLTLLSGADGEQTLIQKSQAVQLPVGTEVQPHVASQTNTSARAPAKAPAFRVTKKVPRPRNCWIIFRDNTYNRMKREDSNNTVYDISSKCSALWADLSPEEKGIWREAAFAEANEHARLYPDYKYSPRKPGEKKKRNSRNKGGKQAKKAKKPEKTEEIPIGQASGIPSGFEMSAATITPATTATGMVSTEVGNALMQNLVSFAESVPSDVDNTYVHDLASFTEPLPADDDNSFGDFFGLNDQLSFTDEELASFTDGKLAGDSFDELHTAEALRQHLLDLEFGGENTTDPTMNFLSDDAFAFRSGADGSATLPSIYNDTF